MLIIVNKSNSNNITIENEKYGKVKCTGDDTKLPDIGIDYMYLQWGDAPWYEKYYIDLNNRIVEFTEDQLNYLVDLVTNWEQPLGQEGNPSFSQVVATKLLELKKAYTKANEVDIAYMDTIFQVDKKSQDLIVSALSAGSVPTGFFWLDKVDNKVAMTFVQLQGLSGTILIRNQNNFVKMQELKAQVKATDTQEELDLILW